MLFRFRYGGHPHDAEPQFPVHFRFRFRGELRPVDAHVGPAVMNGDADALRRFKHRFCQLFTERVRESHVAHDAFPEERVFAAAG